VEGGPGVTIQPIRDVGPTARFHPHAVRQPRVDRRHELGGDKLEWRMTPESEMGPDPPRPFLEPLKLFLRWLLGAH
jgi:hypothetical protein